MSAAAFTVSVLTPPGAAGVAVLALSGPPAALSGALAALFRPRSGRPPQVPEAGRIVYGDIVAGGQVVDDVLVSVGPDGDVEIHCHGSEAVIGAILGALRSLGAAVAPAGTSARRVPADSPAPAIEAEVLAVLPAVMTWRSAELLAAQAVSGLAGAMRQALRTGRPPAVRPLRVGRRLIEPPKVAIIGRPNVGKSTLANALFGRQRSIVTDAPGTTRDYIAEPADLLGFAVWLIDTAGRRHTPDPVEAEGVRRSAEQAGLADVVLAVLDGSAPPTLEDHALLAAHGTDPRCLWLLNKADRPAAWSPPVPALPISAQAGTGLDALRRAVLERLDLADLTPDTPILFTPRQERLFGEGDFGAILDGRSDAPKPLLRS